MPGTMAYCAGVNGDNGQGDKAANDALRRPARAAGILIEVMRIKRRNVQPEGGIGRPPAFCS